MYSFERFNIARALATCLEKSMEVSYVKDNLIVCVCGRQFIINENLKIQKFPY